MGRRLPHLQGAEITGGCETSSGARLLDRSSGGLQFCENSVAIPPSYSGECVEFSIGYGRPPGRGDSSLHALAAAEYRVPNAAYLPNVFVHAALLFPIFRR